MDEHKALLQAQEQVKAPKKDQATREWCVEYLNGLHWTRQTFSTDESAYVYYYTKLAEFKARFMTQDRRQR
ncbi:MAG: hypothetical protein II670_02085 [Alphaproteobacteria bacterium]|nr:hypothetical protein [Alphaproteobacteria bacterium]